MQTVGVAAAFHDTARLLVHNLHLSVYHDVFVVLLKHGIGLQQLVDGMYAFRLDGIVGEQGILLGQTLFFAQVLFIFQFGKLGGDVGQYEEGGVGRVSADEVNTLVGEVDAVQLLVDDEVERIGHFVHALVVLLHVDFLCLQHTGLDALFAQELDERLVLGQSLVAAVEGQETFFLLLLVVGGDEALGVGQVLGSQSLLGFHQSFYQRAELFEQLVVAFGHRTGDDQRRTGIVNQDGVDLVDDGVVVLALHEVFRTDGHVVAQVIETEFVVGTEGDVGQVGTAAGIGVGLVFVDAVHAQAMEHVERSHPLGVTLGQVVVHCHYMYAVTGQGIEEYGEGSHEGFSFTGCHFGNLTLVQHDAAEELYVVVYHVPGNFVTTRHPVVLVDGLVALDADKVLGGGQLAVEVVGRNHDFFIFRETAGCRLDDGKGGGQHFVECFLVDIQYLLFDFVYLGKDFFAFLQFRVFHGGL